MFIATCTGMCFMVYLLQFSQAYDSRLSYQPFAFAKLLANVHQYAHYE